MQGIFKILWVYLFKVFLIYSFEDEHMSRGGGSKGGEKETSP